MGIGALAFGQGRKPKSAHDRWLGGNAGKRAGANGASGETGDGPTSPAPPRGLTAQQRDAWLELAPAATALRTLTVETRPAFRELVEMIVVKRQMYTRIRRDGFMVPSASSLRRKGRKDYKPHPLLASYRGWVQMVQVAMHRFRLAPIGKEIVGDEPNGDPWDEFDEPAKESE